MAVKRLPVKCWTAGVGYSADLVRALARCLGKDFVWDLFVENLWNFLGFHKSFPNEEKIYTLRRELIWLRGSGYGG